MNKSFVAVLAGSALSLGACSNMDSDTASVGTGAAVGAGAGAIVGTVAAGAPIEGALIGAAVGGIAGAIWADQDNDGRADGYYQNGQYYPGSPAGYYSGTARRDCRSVAGGAGTGAAVGAAAGAGVGALVSGVSVLEGAIAGALVGGVAGAVWTDANNDGCVDGYTRDGRYYEGTPADYQAGSRPAERG